MTKSAGQPPDATATSSSKTSDNCAHVQEGRGRYKKLQASQPHLSSWGNHGANPPKGISKHMKGTGETIRDAPRTNLA